MIAFKAQATSRLLLLLLATITVWQLPLQAADQSSQFHTGFSVTPVPDWVMPIEPAIAKSDADTTGGTRHLLIDRQYRDDGNTIAKHRHFVTEIVGQAGLSNNSNLSVSFDPLYERLEFHSATIVRAGRESDRLKSARINVARTEKRSHQALLNGEVTALVVLPDVQVGDRVEVRYTVFGRNPVFGSRHHSTWRMRWGVPVERSVLRITVPHATTLTYTPRPEATFSESINASLHTYQWQIDGLETTDAEKNTTDWYPNSDRLDVTAYQDWQEVADWGAVLFAGHSTDGDAYRRLSQSVRQVAKDQGLQSAIAMAIDHVQKQIRYYGVELGENSHRPHSPDEVLNNGYGDCKDKALLLVSLLDEIGVKAWPMLVSSRTRRGIVDQLPSPGVFNHVIVLIEQSGAHYWVDATDNSQSGMLGYRGQPEYGAGLVLGKPGDSLITRKAPMPKAPSSSTHDRFYLSSMGGAVDFVTSTSYRGKQANRLRRYIDKTGKHRLQKQSREYFSELYGKLSSLDSIQIDEDKHKNAITITESYRLEDFWDIDKHSEQAEFDTYAIRLRNQLDTFKRVDRDRKAPLPISGPAWVTHRIQYYPNVASTKRPLEESTFGLDGFDYQDTEYVMGNSLVFDSELKISVDELAVDQLSSYKKFQERVMRSTQGGRFYQSINKDQVELGVQTTILLNELGVLHQ